MFATPNIPLQTNPSKSLAHLLFIVSRLEEVELGNVNYEFYKKKLQMFTDPIFIFIIFKSASFFLWHDSQIELRKLRTCKAGCKNHAKLVHWVEEKTETETNRSSLNFEYVYGMCIVYHLKIFNHMGIYNSNLILKLQRPNVC